MLDDDEEPPESDIAVDIPDSTPEIPDSTPDVPDSTPEIPDPSNASPELRRTFVRLVLVFNLALLATGVGLVLVVFGGQWRDGGGLFLVGLVTFAYGYWRYRNRPAFE